MPQFTILVVDDDKIFTESIKAALRGFNVIILHSPEEVRASLSYDIDLILLDLVFDDSQPEKLQGLELITTIRESYPDIPVIIMTNYSSTDTSFLAGKLGAADYLNKKNLNWSEWKLRLESYCKKSAQLKAQSKRIKELESKYDDMEIIGISSHIHLLKRRLKDLAENSDSINILLCGETGTGKNLAVRYFRNHSLRKNKPFKEFSISELSETVLESELFGHVKGAFTGAEKDKTGLFEEADGGILFLDEIGDCDLKVQKKITRFIEDKTITPVGSTQSKRLNVQLIFATNQNLQLLVREGRFREDLYHRINAIKIELVPIRERKEDIKLLADYFFHHFKEKENTNLKQISGYAYEILLNYGWPGNVRELQLSIWSACTKARLTNDTVLAPHHFTKEISNDVKKLEENSSELTIQEKKALIELEAIEKALEKANGKKSEAAQKLGMSLDQMRCIVQKHFHAKDSTLKIFPLITKEYSYLKK